MYIPSYDFRIFDIPYFSPLQAQEFGADTTFSASTPLGYIDNSFNQLFQQGASETRERLRQIRDEADRMYKQAGGNDQTTPQIPNVNKGDCPTGYKRVTPFGIGALSYCGKELRSDDSGAIGDKRAPPGMSALETGLNSLPQGAGLFLIAIVAIIFLLLFVRR